MKERIKAVRQTLGLTQAQFAERINLSRNYIAMVEIGQREPSDRTLSDISRMFNVSSDWLLTGEGEMFNNLEKERELALLFRQVSGQPETELDEFKRKLLVTLSKLDTGAWEVLLQIAKDLTSEE